MVVAGSVCVDRYEAFIERVDDAGATVESLSPYRPPPANVPTAARSVAGAVPHGYVSGLEAERACRGAGKRLCTSDEWLRACRGAAGNVYPYGNARRAGVCNDAYPAGHPAATCYGTTASWIYSEIDYAGINQQLNTVDRAGANAGCVTAEGVFDLMGNLHEWVRDTAGTPPTSAVDFRGGFYADTSRNGDGCLYATSAHSFSHWDYSTGFRCCAALR
jgi:formylglycine-generating enzyme required for sulfatase activity